MLLQGKTAIVSGAANPRGIGFATARILAEHGARVAILDLDVHAASDAAAALGAQHLGLACDVADKAQCEAAAGAVHAATGRIDVLINNAGITEKIDVLGIDESHWDRMIAINLRGVLYLSQAVLPFMLAQGSGSIACTSSGAVHSGGGFVGGAHYCAAKGGVIALGRAMAREYSPKGIRVNCVAPGLVLTDINAGLIPADLLEDIRRKVPMQRLGTPQDIANTFLYLASDLSSYVTGSLIDVNGGLFMH